MGRDAVFLHNFKEVLRDSKANFALALYRAANGVGAGVEYAVFAGSAVFKKQAYYVGFFV